MQRNPQESQQVAQLSQRDRATHEILRFAKSRSGMFEPPFGGLTGRYVLYLYPVGKRMIEHLASFYS